MTRAGTWLAIAALVLASCFGAGQAADKPGEKEDIAKLTQLSNAWDQAIVAKNEAAVAGNMAEDFRIIDGYGAVDGKRKFVADILDARLAIDPYTVEEFEVRLYGDTALLSGRTHMTGRYDGKPFESNYRYIDIYVRRGGQWQIVSVQITKFPPPGTKAG